MASKVLRLMSILMAVVAIRAQFEFVPGPGLARFGAGLGYRPVPPVPVPVLPATDFHTYPRYKYSYGVEDGLTGDFKTASEHRDGDVVKGHYSLREPDGNLRHVTYVADLHGFRANVQRTPGVRGY